MLTELESAFRFNDAVLRHLTLSCKAAITEKSAMMVEVEREESAKTTDHKPAPKVDDESKKVTEIKADAGKGDKAEPVTDAGEIVEAKSTTDAGKSNTVETITDAEEGEAAKTDAGEVVEAKPTTDAGKSNTVETITDVEEGEAAKTKTVEEGAE